MVRGLRVEGEGMKVNEGLRATEGDGLLDPRQTPPSGVLVEFNFAFNRS